MRRCDLAFEPRSQHLTHNVSQERFKSQPGKYQQFQNTGFGPWREDQPAEEARAQLVELLIGEEDLLERFEEIWPGNHGENGTGGIGA